MPYMCVLQRLFTLEAVFVYSCWRDSKPSRSCGSPERQICRTCVCSNVYSRWRPFLFIPAGETPNQADHVGHLKDRYAVHVCAPTFIHAGGRFCLFLLEK